MPKKILITSFFFYPENKPRAFRTYELAKGLSSSGHDVTVVTPTYDCDYSRLNIDYPALILKQIPKVKKQIKFDNTSQKKSRKKSIFNNSIVKYLFYFFIASGRDAKYAYQLALFLRKNKSEYDVVISISYPYSVHLGTILALALGYIKTKKYFTEFGDTFVGCPALPNSIIHRIYQKIISIWTNCIVVPTDKAIPNFSIYKNEKSIKVIPQGYDFNEVKIEEYSGNSVPTFGYAGSFHAQARNPKIFLEYLSKLDRDFRFVVYSNIKDSVLVEMFDHYKSILGDKLIIRGIIPRLEVLKELSTFDFLIFEENLSNNQSPSKIVDYKLTTRPIFSFSQNELSEIKFSEFLNGDYTNQDYLEFNINDFSINHTIKQYDQLIYEENN